MTGVRADIAELLRAGATQAQISEQLHVTTHTVRRTREILRIPLPPGRAKRTRAELDAIEDQAVTMLRAGASLARIYAELRLSRNRITELRRLHAIPVPAHQHVSDATRRTVDEAFDLHTKPTATGGHLLWTGPRSGRNLQLWASGRRYNPRIIAFRRHHGRDPDGRLQRHSICDEPLCIAGAHLTDRRIRQAHAHADQAYDHIFGPAA